MKDGEHYHNQGDPEGKHNHRKLAGLILLAIIFGLIAYILAQSAQTTADNNANITNVYELVDNNTNLGCGESGTCEIQPNVLYYANTSPINVYMKFHVTTNNAHVVANITVNGTVKQWKDFTTVQADQNDSMFVQVPKGNSWKIQNSSTIHHVEIYLGYILSGRNGTLSLNQTFITNGTSFNATYDQTTRSFNNNYSSQTFPNSSIYSNNLSFAYIPRETFGLHWNVTNNNNSIAPGAFEVYEFADLGGGTVVASYGNSGAGIARSVDYGSTWYNVTTISGETIVLSVVNMGNGIVLAGTAGHGKLLKSNDYGLTWKDNGTLIPSEVNLYSLVNLGNGVVIAGTDPNGKIARSTDYGGNWTIVGTITPDAMRIRRFVNLGNGIVLAATQSNGTLLRSTDYGASWTSLGIILAGQTELYSLVYLGNGVVLMGTSPGGYVLRSTDYGLTWTSEGQMVSGETIVYNFANIGNGVVVAGTCCNAKIARSTDYGLTWTNLGNFTPGETYIISLARLDNGMVLAGTYGHAKTIRSDNGMDEYGKPKTDADNKLTTQIRAFQSAYMQTFPNNTYSNVTYDAETIDSLGEWNGTAFFPRQSGLYSISSGVDLVYTTKPGASGRFIERIFKNNVAGALVYDDSKNGTSANLGFMITVIDYYSAGDVVDVRLNPVDAITTQSINDARTSIYIYKIG